ncbi:MAG TPA: hypothetical protein ENN86_02230 [Desulfobacteraceae bacterium]|nr:hypothetical protein [Desulfobacteraceae bacterium]
MKKILSPLTGIVLLITILIAGACKSVDKDDKTRDSKQVIIYLKKVVEIDGKMHLEMYNSYAPDIIVVDSLWTDIRPGIKVIWVPERESGIKIIKRIGSSTKKGKIFKEDASKVFLSNKFKLRIPEDAIGDEKYDIEFENHERNSGNIDPYLRIPDREATDESEDGQDPLP